jgi:hypothetical protein
MRGSSAPDAGGGWLTVKEAAAMVGYSAPYFREIFCRADAPLVTLRARDIVRCGSGAPDAVRCGSGTPDTGRRRGNIYVSRASVEALIRADTTEAQGRRGC